MASPVGADTRGGKSNYLAAGFYDPHRALWTIVGHCVAHPHTHCSLHGLGVAPSGDTGSQLICQHGDSRNVVCSQASDNRDHRPSLAEGTPGTTLASTGRRPNFSNFIGLFDGVFVLEVDSTH